jgi:transcriptional regulator with XRE-family HTH domain
MNWIKIISELSAAGATQKEMADRCFCGQSTISEISRGEIKNPAYSIGRSLIDLHSEIVGRPIPEEKKAA